MKRLIVFDLDGTLAESRMPIDSTIANLLSELLAKTSIAIISGATLEQFQERLVSKLPPHSRLDSLILLPTNGAALYFYREGNWKQEYAIVLSAKEKKEILDALSKGLARTNIITEPLFGDLIEDRGMQVSFSGRGQDAPLEEKKKWDPTGEKRRRLVESIANELSGFEIRIGGTTTVDITRKNINKGYGVRSLLKKMNIESRDAVFIGNQFKEGENDFAVRETGVRCLEVKNPLETGGLIASMLNRQDHG